MKGESGFVRADLAGEDGGCAAGAGEIRGKAVWWALIAVKKTGWFLLSLWGASLVTFVVVQMALAGPSVQAPGASSARRLDDTELDELRKVYGWDLPLLVNWDVQDRGRKVRLALRRFEADPGAPAARKRLVAMGTLIFPEVFQFLRKDAPLRASSDLCSLVGQILQKRGWSPVPKSRAECLAWWQAHGKEFSPARIHGLVAKVQEGRDEAARRLTRLGRFSVRYLMVALFREGTEAARLCRISQVLSSITGHAVWCDVQGGRAASRTVLADWREWWLAHEDDFRDLSRSERLWGLFSKTRYGRWMARLFGGRLGMSSYFRKPVAAVLEKRFPVTMGIGLAALALAFLVGVPLGVWIAVRNDRPVGRLMDSALLVAYCSPSYVVGLALIFLLGGLGGLSLFPSGGLHGLPGSSPLGDGLLDLLWHSVLPVVTLAFGLTAMVARYAAESVTRAMAEPHILAARARGLPESWVLWRHGVRNGLLPLIALLGLMIPALVTGAVVVETIFDLPGFGGALMVALWNRDTNLFMGILVISVLATMSGLALSDLGMWIADPRVRRKGEAS